jgi:hypothetical protein
MKQKSAKLQSIISVVFSFILTVLILILLLAMGLYFGAFNEKIIKLKVSESNYYNETYSLIYDNAKTIVADAGLPVTVLEDAVTLERVYIGGKYYVEDVLAGKQPTYKTEKLEDALRSNIDNYLATQKVTITDELKVGTDELVAKVSQEYRRGIQFDFINSISKLKQAYMHIILIGVPILLVLMAAIIFILTRMYKYKHRGIRYINSSVITASAMVGIITLIMLITRSYNITAQPKYYMVFLNNYFKWNIQIYLCMAGFGIITSVLLFVLTRHLKENIR